MHQKGPTDRDRYRKSCAFHYGDGINFGLVRVDPGVGRATVEFVGADGETLFSAEKHIEGLCPKLAPAV